VSVATTLCRAQVGLRAPLVHVEVNLGSGLPTFVIVGLPEAAVRESKERVRAALENCGFEFPPGRITVNLAPADLPKEGGRFDLSIALGILIASAQLRPLAADPPAAPREFYGELGLAGELKPVRGMLPAAAQALQAGHEVLVPSANLEDVLIVDPRAAVHGLDDLRGACAYLRGARQPAVRRRSTPAHPRSGPPLDLEDIRGQPRAKRALVIAAAGGHSLLLVGPPGSGKSMLAQRLPGLLPPLTNAEALEVAAIRSMSSAGFDPRQFGVRPFRAPHHSASAPAIVGGGPRALPGEASLAHHGVLFLDELPEFDHRALEALREPLETRGVAIARARIQAHYPAGFILIAAMNPCPCGYRGDASVACRCSPRQVERYRARVSGPLLDRIDLHVEAARVPLRDLEAQPSGGETTVAAAAAICRARTRQIERCGRLNAELGARELRLRAAAGLVPAARELLGAAFERLGLTARSYHKVLRVARTIADLDAAQAIAPVHVAEAVQFRRSLAE